MGPRRSAGSVPAVKVRLLGTGSADGWPNPWCSCASCAWARQAEQLRTHTSVLVDDELLLDFGPDVPRAASRLGLSLGGVRWLLLGHGHPDHSSPPALMWRNWSSSATQPLEVIGPPGAISACTEFLERHRNPAVSFTEVRPGDELTRGPYRLRAWEARHGGPEVGPAVLWDVAGADDRRLLYASDTLPLPQHLLPAGSYDLVLLEETYGDGRPFGDHLGLDTFADMLSAMRRSGAVRPSTRAVAVHLGHANPPGDELARRLAMSGAELHPDGAVLDLSAEQATKGDAAATPSSPHRVLVTGGARSGKSDEAERRLRGEPEVVYVATAPELPDDPEWTARLATHRERRPAHWQTVETAVLAPLLREPGPPLLIDDLGLWLTRAEEDADELVDAVRATARRVVLVTSEVGSGVVPASTVGRSFRDDLGRLNARVAAEVDEVWQCVAGLAQRLK